MPRCMSSRHQRAAVYRLAGNALVTTGRRNAIAGTIPTTSPKSRWAKKNAICGTNAFHGPSGEVHRPHVWLVQGMFGTVSADGVPAAVGERSRGHGQQAVHSQRRHQGGNVAGVPGGGEPLGESALCTWVRDAGGADAPGRPVGLQGGSGPLPGAVHRGLAGLQDLRRLGGGEGPGSGRWVMC